MADEARGFGGQRGDEREGERERRGSLPAGCLSRFRSIWAWSGVDRLLLGVKGGGRGPHVPRGAGGGPRHHRRRPLHRYDHHGPQPRTSSSSLILVPKAVRSDLDSPPHHPKRTFPFGKLECRRGVQGKKHTSSASVCRTHTGVEVLEIVREMSGLASFGQVVPAIVGMMGCSFGVFYCVRNLKVSEKKRKKKTSSSCVRKTKTRPWLSPTTRAHRGGCRAARQVPPPGTPPSRGLHSFRITLRLSSLRY